jgi:hypothetical protein
MKKIAALALVLAVQCLVGCTGPAFWKKTPASIDAVNWTVVPEDHVRWLGRTTPNYDRAVQMLSERPAIELSPELVREFWTYGSSASYLTADPTAAAPSDGSRAFLVRGVAYDPALRCRVWCSENNGAVWTHFQSWSDEGPIATVLDGTRGSPVIVFLKAKPGAVYATAAMTGNGVMKGTMSHP